jgi:hypothetical protein
MICPQCNAEYREGFTFCSTCKVSLIPGTHPNEYRDQGGTPALVAGLLIGVATALLYVVRELPLSLKPAGSLAWYVVGGAFVIALIAYFIQRRFRGLK